MSINTPQQAFSLVELSIVLVILGLLVGGVLSGRSLIHAAELRNVIREQETFRLSVNAFRARFNALPGDFRDATRLWGRASNCLSFSIAQPMTPDNTTCNGNGNGRIEPDADAVEGRSEHMLVWQHMSRAGLMQGYFDTKFDSSNETALFDRVYPASKFGSARWHTFYRTAGHVLPTQFDDARTGHVLQLMSNFLYFDGGKALTPADAYYVDMKIDDGMPATGNVVAPPGEGDELGLIRQTDCTVTPDGNTTTADDKDALYNVAYGSLACALTFYEPY